MTSDTTPGQTTAHQATGGPAAPGPATRRGLGAQLRSISGRLQVLPNGARAHLRRMDPERPGRATGAVVALLLGAQVPEEDWGERGHRGRGDDAFRRWSRICHVMAILAGAGGRETHAPAWEAPPDDASGEPDAAHHAHEDGVKETARSSPERQIGRAIAASGYSELRMMRLTSARGPALADQVRRLARYLAQGAALPIDLTPLAELILFEGRDAERADAARLAIARAYYRALPRGEAAPSTTTPATREAS